MTTDTSDGTVAVLTGYTDPDAEVVANHLFYDLAMTAVSRLTHAIAHDLRPHGATAPAPGLTRTEAIVAPTAGEASVPAERGPGPR